MNKEISFEKEIRKIFLVTVYLFSLSIIIFYSYAAIAYKFTYSIVGIVSFIGLVSIPTAVLVLLYAFFVTPLHLFLQRYGMYRKYNLYMVLCFLFTVLSFSFLCLAGKAYQSSPL